MSTVDALACCMHRKAKPSHPRGKARSAKSDVNFVSLDGKTALQYAGTFSPETLPIVLDARADYFFFDGDTRLHCWKIMQYACAGPNCFVGQSVEHLQSHHWEDFKAVICLCNPSRIEYSFDHTNSKQQLAS